MKTIYLTNQSSDDNSKDFVLQNNEYNVYSIYYYN